METDELTIVGWNAVSHWLGRNGKEYGENEYKRRILKKAL